MAGEEDYGAEGNGGGGGAVPASRVGAGAAAKGRAGADLPPGFAAARAGDLEGLKNLVEGSGDRWDPRAAVDRNGSSPLDWAAGEGRLEVCRWVGLGCRRGMECVGVLFLVRLGRAVDLFACGGKPTGAFWESGCELRVRMSFGRLPFFLVGLGAFLGLTGVT